MSENKVYVENLLRAVRDGERAQEQMDALNERMRRLEQAIARQRQCFDVTFEARMEMADYEYRMLEFSRAINLAKQAKEELVRIGWVSKTK